MSCHITPLISNSLRGRYTHTDIHTKAILRNQVASYTPDLKMRHLYRLDECEGDMLIFNVM